MPKIAVAAILAAAAAAVVSPAAAAAQAQEKSISMGIRVAGTPAGPEVAMILSGRTAEAMGFKVGDILVEADGKPISPQVLEAYMDGKKAGDGLAFKVKRGEALIGIGTFVIILVTLLIIFRAPILAFLPLITIGLVSAIANGLIAYATKLFDLQANSSISSILIVVLFGVGTDYFLFLMFRYRERLRLGDEPKQAMINAVDRVGEAIASAAGLVGAKRPSGWRWTAIASTALAIGITGQSGAAASAALCSARRRSTMLNTGSIVA